ncbi:hypothetical protein Rhal01_02710 [Rubritalea halochordaticola]|uniref:Ice-binding protein C-terminal domain-containing protein n=1 Tax=Rubritalea halochordaticola TaxID=714537 RepID=A0ABP9V1G0_9BACT
MFRVRLTKRLLTVLLLFPMLVLAESQPELMSAQNEVSQEKSVFNRIPEPATCALIGLGGMLLILRKRRG